ncbi:MAG TPA: valine--tRNA ligase [Marinilabiliales bacterium]|nr:valine--tRNA ligase [Marinilabiliales bacterium]
MAKYDPKTREKYWQDFWLKEGIYKFDPRSPKPLYSIDTPPPTVSGKLHLGHVFSYTQAEVFARYRRLAGYNVYYPFGMDDNGLPTERLVEQELNIKAQDLPRDKFVAKCLKLVGGYHQAYRNLWQSLGFSVDWDLLYSTISLEVQRLTQTNFIKMYQNGYIYRQNSPALWCSVCQTAVAQAEVEDKAFDSVFYDLFFHDPKGNQIVVATTRPELLPACVAVFVNPADSRYLSLIGTKIFTPLEAEVTVLANPDAKIDKGSGVVMCCTYGDETDLTWKKQYNLPELIIIDSQGRFNDSCSLETMRGHTITEGRQIIVDYLKSKKLIGKDLPLVHDVGVHERCGHPIEIINTPQWFVRVLDIKDQLITLGKKVNWFPAYMGDRFTTWVENLKWDWCISRDRFYGISIPAFFCADCQEVIVSIEPKHTCPKCKSINLVAEKLIFDTWFTSGNTPEINGKYVPAPMSLRPQAHDIIRTWAFYTMVLSYYKTNCIPWIDAAISGHILLRRGEKISKRTGGGDLRPEEEIAKHSADAIRFAMCGAALGQDAYYEENELENGKKLVNKLFNASNFCFMNLSGHRPKALNLNTLLPLDRWLLLKSYDVSIKMQNYFEIYDYAHARDLLTEFFWGVFCDYYLEIIKKRVYDLPDDNPDKISAQSTLFYGLNNILIMASPFIPHITEEIFQSFYPDKIPDAPKSIHLSAWPKMDLLGDFSFLDIQVKSVLEIISLFRIEKSKLGLNIGAEINTLSIFHPTLTTDTLTPFEFDLLAVSRAKKLTLTKSDQFKVEITNG